MDFPLRLVETNGIKVAIRKEKEAMGRTHNRAAAKLRSRLVVMLGGKCASCGTIENLEFHVHSSRPEGTNHHGLGVRGRHKWYLQKARAGVLRLLCRECHQSVSVLRPVNKTNNSAVSVTPTSYPHHD